MKSSGSKRKSTASLESLLTKPRAKSRICETCAHDGAVAVIAQWRELGEICTFATLYTAIKQEHPDYPVGPDALKRHLRVCLGITRGR